MNNIEKGLQIAILEHPLKIISDPRAVVSAFEITLEKLGATGVRPGGGGIGT